MAVIDECADRIFESLDGKLTKEEVRGIVKLIDERARRHRLPFDEASKRFLDQVLGEIKAIRKRKRENLIKTAERRRFYNDFFDETPLGRTAEGIVAAMRSRLQGTWRNVREGRFGVDQVTRRNERVLLRNFLLNLEPEDLKALRDGVLDKQIMEEVFQLTTRGGKPGITGSKRAQKIASVIRDLNKAELELLNRSGATIRDLEGYVMRQTHDPEKVGKVDRDTWVRTIMPLLHQEKTFKGMNQAEAKRFLEGAYDDIVHGRSRNTSGVSESDELLKIVGTEKPLAEKLSRARVLHFKSGSALFEYNDLFGRKSLDETVAGSIRSTARNAALIRYYGSNPRAAFENDIKRLTRTKDGADINLTESQKAELEQAWSVASGLSDRPGDNIWTKISEAESFINNTSKLGAAVFASFSDVASQAANLMAKTGEGNIFSRMAEVIQRDLQIMTDPAARKEALELFDIGITTMLGHNAVRFAGTEGDVPGMFSNMQTMFWKLSGISFWTDANKVAHAAMFSRELASKATRNFSDLGDRLGRSLMKAGISVPEWEILRRATRKTQSFGDVIDHRRIQDVDEGLVRQAMESGGLITEAEIKANVVEAARSRFVRKELKGRKFKDAGDRTKAVQQKVDEFNKRAKTDLKGEIDRLVERRWKSHTDKFRQDLSLKFTTYLGDQAEMGVPTPGAFEKQFTYRGTANDTPMGFALRAFWRFKQFPLTIITKQMPNLIMAGGGEKLADGLTNRGSLAIAGQFIAGMTVMGYTAMTVKDLLKGKTPRDPTDPVTIKAAMVQGGALSFFGDTMLNNWDKYSGRTLLAGLAGPTFAQFNDLGEVMGVLNDPDADQGKKRSAKAAMRLIVNNTPFGNLWMTRGVLEHNVLLPLNEYASPGYIDRYKQRLEEERGQTLLFEPSP